MVATTSIDAIEWLRKQVEAPDGLREMLTQMVNLLMSSEIETICGAGYGERNEGRVNSRNGYRSRLWDTRVGTIDLQIPKLRHGTYLGGRARRRGTGVATAEAAGPRRGDPSLLGHPFMRWRRRRPAAAEGAKRRRLPNRFHAPPGAQGLTWRALR